MADLWEYVSRRLQISKMRTVDLRKLLNTFLILMAGWHGLYCLFSYLRMHGMRGGLFWKIFVSIAWVMLLRRHLDSSCPSIRTKAE